MKNNAFTITRISRDNAVRSSQLAIVTRLYNGWTSLANSHTKLEILAREAFSPSRTDVTPVSYPIFRATENDITWFAQLFTSYPPVPISEGEVLYSLSYTESNYIRNIWEVKDICRVVYVHTLILITKSLCTTHPHPYCIGLHINCFGQRSLTIERKLTKLLP
jgi:hypothetical protein